MYGMFSQIKRQYMAIDGFWPMILQIYDLLCILIKHIVYLVSYHYVHNYSPNK